MAGIQLVHVPYAKGAAPAITDLLGGHVDMMLPDISGVLEHIRSGALVALAVTGEKRSPQLPNVPTMGEAGYPKVVSETWFGLIAPAKTPPATLNALHGAAMAALKSADVIKQIELQGSVPAPMTQDEFRALIVAEQAKWKLVIECSGPEAVICNTIRAASRTRSSTIPRPPWWCRVPSAGSARSARRDVVNLAPYSFFNIVAGNPPFVIFSSSARKHSQTNAETSGEFVFNMATYDLRNEMNLTSGVYDDTVSEPELAKLEMVPSRYVRPPRVARSPIALECNYLKTIDMVGSTGKRSTSSLILGEVINVYIDDSVIVDGQIDVSRIRPIARLGYMDYSVVDTVFSMMRPGEGGG